MTAAAVVSDTDRSPATSPSPLVSIGMPVRNGQKYIREAIDSILAQTFTDWELIVCDNASTDNTEQIVREYTARDARIRYHRNERDIGPAGNHNVSFELSRGKYFRWHAHDDMIGPEYLARCVELLESQPDAVLAHTRTTIVDERGKFLEDYNFVLRTDSLKPEKRFAELVLVKHRMHRAVEIFGLMRSSALRETPLEGCYARGDSVLLVRMVLRGRFVEAPQRLFLSRSHPSQSMQQLPSRLRDSQGRARFSSFLGTGPLPPPEWWDPALRNRITFPEWKVMREYWRTIGEVNLPAASRLKCHAVMLAWVCRNVHKLARDLIIAAEQLLSPAIDRLRPAGAARQPEHSGAATAGQVGATAVSGLPAAAKKA